MSDSEPETANFRTRTQVLFARDAPKAIILRRGPKRHFNLITWELETDTFTSGQWMKGIVTLCDLSPSGEKLIYWAAQYHASAPRHLPRHRIARDDGDVLISKYEPLVPIHNAPKLKRRRKVPRYMRGREQISARFPPPRNVAGVWTAVSRPPYFSALAIWPCFGHWTGGGYFHDESTLFLGEDVDGLGPIENTLIPSHVRIVPAWATENRGRPPRPCGIRPKSETSSDFDAFSQSLKQQGAEWVDWVHPVSKNELAFACDGRIFRLERWMDFSADEYLKKATMIEDLRPLTFQMTRAPAAVMRW